LLAALAALAALHGHALLSLTAVALGLVLFFSRHGLLLGRHDARVEPRGSRRRPGNAATISRV
jgi:hypothetical protein